MTTSNIGQPYARQIRREAATHLFAIGQFVQLKNGLGRTLTPATIYQITGTLPARGNSPQYRIRNDEERHERVTTQDDLEPIAAAQTDTSLLERTFGHG